MRTQHILYASLLFAFSISLSIPTRAQEQHDSAREESAHHFINQAKEFKRQASEYHALVEIQTREAKHLIAQSKKLESSSKKLRAGVKEDAALLRPFSLDTKQYNLHLQEFQDHSKIYNAHLADYEKELLKAQAAEGQLKSSCKEFADHVQKFHIPGVRPPHVCVQMQWESKDMQKVARGFVQDQAKSHEAEAALAKQESKLADAAHERAALEAKLLQKANIDELERTQGAMLLKEYQQIEREFRMLQQEKKSLQKK
jgi:hypothetical protein